MSTENKEVTNDTVVKALMALLSLPENQRNKLIEICQKYPLQKVVTAIKILQMNVNKHLKQRKTYTLEEFEELLKRIRW